MVGTGNPDPGAEMGFQAFLDGELLKDVVKVNVDEGWADIADDRSIHGVINQRRVTGNIEVRRVPMPQFRSSLEAGRFTVKDESADDPPANVWVVIDQISKSPVFYWSGKNAANVCLTVATALNDLNWPEDA